MRKWRLVATLHKKLDLLLDEEIDLFFKRDLTVEDKERQEEIKIERKTVLTGLTKLVAPVKELSTDEIVKKWKAGKLPFSIITKEEGEIIKQSLL